MVANNQSANMSDKENNSTNEFKLVSYRKHKENKKQKKFLASPYLKLNRLHSDIVTNMKDASIITKFNAISPAFSPAFSPAISDTTTTVSSLSEVSKNNGSSPSKSLTYLEALVLDPSSNINDISSISAIKIPLSPILKKKESFNENWFLKVSTDNEISNSVNNNLNNDDDDKLLEEIQASQRGCSEIIRLDSAMTEVINANNLKNLEVSDHAPYDSQLIDEPRKQEITNIVLSNSAIVLAESSSLDQQNDQPTEIKREYFDTLPTADFVVDSEYIHFKPNTSENIRKHNLYHNFYTNNIIKNDFFYING
jgi:hypothetical protein